MCNYAEGYRTVASDKEFRYEELKLIELIERIELIAWCWMVRKELLNSNCYCSHFET